MAAVALAAGVFVSGANAAPPLCGSKQCAEEITAACGALSGADFRACKQSVLEQCNISGETFCSCTNPALPACGPTTTSTTTTTTTTPGRIQCCLQTAPCGPAECQLMSAGHCANAGGVNVGPGTCAAPCPSTTIPPGACCTQSTPGGPFDQCSIQGLCVCGQLGGRFLFGQFSCTPNPCATTSTTTTTTSTTTTTTESVGGAFLEFTTAAPGGTCGNMLDGSNVLIRNLTCGGLNIGGGASIVPEGLSPDGATSLFALSCTGSSCTIGPTSIAPPVNSTAPDCTDVGCNFGTPLPIPNPMIPTISLCVLNTWGAPASGTLDLTTGAAAMSVTLAFDEYLTGNVTQPCPKCVAGTCDRGPRAGMACTTTSSTGYTRDCPTGGVGSVATPCPPTGNPSCAPTNCPCTPGGGQCCDGSHVGPIAVNLSPLTTGTASDTDPGGLFCPGQGAVQVGCFGSAGCRTINESGAAAGPISTGVPASATLASVFCVGGTPAGLVDAALNVPGPGAVALPGTFLVSPTTTTTTTSLPPCTADRECGACQNTTDCGGSGTCFVASGTTCEHRGEGNVCVSRVGIICQDNFCNSDADCPPTMVCIVDRGGSTTAPLCCPPCP